MDRIKSTALTSFGIIAMLAILGVFASVGLAVVGALVVLGVVGAIAAWITSFVPRRSAAASETA